MFGSLVASQTGTSANPLEWSSRGKTLNAEWRTQVEYSEGYMALGGVCLFGGGSTVTTWREHYCRPQNGEAKDDRREPLWGWRPSGRGLRPQTLSKQASKAGCSHFGSSQPAASLWGRSRGPVGLLLAAGLSGGGLSPSPLPRDRSGPRGIIPHHPAPLQSNTGGELCPSCSSLQGPGKATW